jgi:hypothetical protein
MSAKPALPGVGDPLCSLRRRAKEEGKWTYRHPLTLPAVVDRNLFLSESVSRGRRVIHIGCASEGETRSQFREGRLLFAQIEQLAVAQLGVDPDADGMTELSELVGPRWPLQICLLSEVDPNLLAKFAPEIILVPETVEHVPDAGTLLAQVARVAGQFGAEVVVTVPNALSWVAICYWWSGADYAHPDHVAVYTPRVLQSLLEKSGLQPIEIRPYVWGSPSPRLGLAAAARILVGGRRPMRERVSAIAASWIGRRFPDGWIARATVQDGNPSAHDTEGHR